MRTNTTSKFWMPLLTAVAVGTLAMATLSTGCADAPESDDGNANATDEDAAGADGTISGDATLADGEVAKDGAATDKDGGAATDKDGGTTTDKDGQVADGGGATVDGGGSQADGGGSGGDDAATEDGGSVKADVPPKKKLNLPDCALGCGSCAKCPDAMMCVDGKTYTNDCYAICDLQAFDWPAGHTLYQGKCPDCPKCGPNDKAGDKPKFCAKTKAGAWVPVMLECELGCVEFPDDADKCAGGKCANTGATCATDHECNKKYIQAGGCEKNNACMQPPSSCPVKKFMPVCASDGDSYQNTCAMDNCDLMGCYPLGSETKSAGCDPGKLTILCEGECYDDTKWKACANDKACKPVCGIHKDNKGISYRNACIASAEGATVGSCDGISATPGDKCSAELYDSRGCCDIDYTIVKPVCASRLGDDNKSTWYTFRSNSEFECLSGAEKNKWSLQYQGPCICQCPDVSKPVCGADGQTYQSACQAQCYGGKNFQWKEGACGGG